MTRKTIQPERTVAMVGKAVLLAGLLADGMFVLPACAQSAAQVTTPVEVGTTTRYFHGQPSRRATAYYESLWGVDTFSVKAVESGELIRFSYRVSDPERAKALSDKDIEPVLIDPVAHVSLVIPSLEKVGKLRQSSAPEVGRSYWMAFSNPGRPVKKGDRVNIVIGQFHVEGIPVE
jgi:hypothetical protein